MLPDLLCCDSLQDTSCEVLHCLFHALDAFVHMVLGDILGSIHAIHRDRDRSSNMIVPFLNTTGIFADVDVAGN